MALIQYGALVSAIKGSINGTTFSNNSAGTITKNRLTGRRSLTTSQSGALSFSKIITIAWNDLTPLQKLDFNNYASLHIFVDRYGVTKTLNGFQWFKILCYNSYYFTGNLITSPPAYSTSPVLPSFSLTLGVTKIQLDWSIPIDTGTTNIFMFSTPPIRATSNLFLSAYRLTSLNGLDVSSSFDFTSKWEQTHGLNYASIASDAKLNINVLVVPVNAVSFVSGLGVSNFGSINTFGVGIGSMAIETTFVVG